jgi:hypothetical protein
MQNKEEIQLKIRYTKAYNQVVRNFISLQLVNKIFLQKISMGILPQEFLPIFNANKKIIVKTKRNIARCSFNGNKKLKEYILKRDGGKCTTCGGLNFLHIHHIKPIHSFPQLAQNPDNLKVLCKKCHIKHHK